MKISNENDALKFRIPDLHQLVNRNPKNKIA